MAKRNNPWPEWDKDKYESEEEYAQELCEWVRDASPEDQDRYFDDI